MERRSILAVVAGVLVASATVVLGSGNVLGALALALGAVSLVSWARFGARPVAAPPVAEAPDRTSIVDGVTGLPDLRYFELALDHRVAAARRHLWPVALVLMEVPRPADGGPLAAPQDGLDRLLLDIDDPMGELAQVVRDTLREADTACRVGARTLALLLEDTTETGGVGTAERLQQQLSRRGVDVRDVRTGVAAYPTHGLDGDEVLRAARRALATAWTAPQGRDLGPVAVAVPKL